MMTMILVSSLLLCAVSPAFAVESLSFDELYKSVGVLGMEYSDKLLAFKGKRVVMKGFMAPPLKAEADFFVLTRQPVALCPFCNSDADWPADIIVVYLGSEQEFVQNNQPIEVTGILEIGVFTDSRSGFVSRLRLVNAHYRTL